MEVMQEFSKSRLGDSVQDCQALLDHHHHKVKEVFEDSRLSALQVEGEQILIRFHEHELSLPATDDYTETVDCVTKLYRQMNEVFCKLEVLSEQRSNQLDQCLALKQFDEDVEQVGTLVTPHDRGSVTVIVVHCSKTMSDYLIAYATKVLPLRRIGVNFTSSTTIGLFPRKSDKVSKLGD